MNVDGIILGIGFVMCMVAYVCGYMGGRADECELWERENRHQ